MEGGKYDQRDQDEQWERGVHGQFSSGPDPARHWLSPDSGDNQGDAGRLDSGCCRHHAVYLARLFPNNWIRYDLEDGDRTVSVAVATRRSFQTGMLPRGRRIMDYILDIEGRHKCAHEQCQCQILSTQDYCSDFCAEADDVDEVELQCECKHQPCALE